MKQHEVVPVTNGADDRTLMLSAKRWESVHAFLVLGTSFFPFRSSFAFHSAFHRVFLQASPAPPSLSFRAQRAIMCYILSRWHFTSKTLFLAASPTQSPKNLCLSYLKRRHTSSNSSSRLCMIISAEEMLQTEARKCCDCALMRNSKIWCFAAQ